MTHPRRYLLRMLVFLVAGGAFAFLLGDGLISAFMANPGFNGFIVGALLLGTVYIIRTVLILVRDVAWLESFRSNRPGLSVVPKPRMLAPMAVMLGDRPEKFSLSATAMRSLLDGISARLDESRDISRYMIGLLIFLGLLGTFWGLMQTIGAISAVIADLSVNDGRLDSVFNDLKRGLQSPLAGMGTAFSSSLFGLAGSLVLGFLELQAGQAQNRFYNDLEDWLSAQTKLGSGTLGIDSDQNVPAYVQALLEQTADSLENLQRTLQRGEEAKIGANVGVSRLTEKIDTLTDQMRTEQTLMAQLAEHQLALKPILTRLDESLSRSNAEDVAAEEIRGHLRSIDAHLARLLEEMASGRAETVQEFRSEIRVLARTIAAVAEKSGR